MDEKGKKILDSLQAQCSRREYCRADMFKKALERTDGDRAAAEEITASLVEDKFVDDLRYASAFAREKASLTGWGPVKIKFALSAKGISKETADEALSEIDSEKAGEKLQKLMEGKWKSLEGDPQAKLKLLKFALSRGYGYDQVKVCAERITKESVSVDI